MTGGEQRRDGRYRIRQTIIVTENTEAETGAPEFHVMNIATGEVFVFGPEEAFIIRHLDGATSFAVLRQRFAEAFGFAFSDQQFREFLAQLRAADILEIVAAEDGGTEDAPARAATSPFGGGRSAAASGPSADRSGRSDQGSGNTTQSTRPTPPFARRLVNPERLFRALAWLFRPIIRPLVWLLIPGILMSFLILFQNSMYLAADMQRAANIAKFWEQYVLSLFLVNLLSRMAQGTTAHAFGAPMDSFGVRLLFGVLPRFWLDRAPILKMDRGPQLWSWASSLLAKLALFVVGTTIWITFRKTGTWLPELALLAGQAGLGAFLFTANPLLPTDGYRWISTYFGDPKIRNTSIRAFVKLFAGGAPERHRTSAERWGILLFGGASLIYTVFLILTILLFVGIHLEERLRGTGVVITVALCGMVLLWAYLTKRTSSKRRAQRQEAAERPTDGLLRMTHPTFAALEPHPGGFGDSNMVPHAMGAAASPTAEPFDYPDLLPQPRSRTLFKRLFWLAFAGILAVVAFLPYPYEVGGDFVILPANKVAVNAQVEGEIVEVTTREAEWVEAGDVLARLSDWEKRRDLAQVQAQYDKALAELDLLLAGAKPEAVEVARREVESAKVKAAHAERRAARSEKLFRTRTISAASFDDARSELRSAEAMLAEAEANLALVESGARTSEVDAARAEVRELKSELEFRQDQLDRTQIRAPADGRVVTPNVHLLLGRYLPAGALFCELSDNRTARAEVEVPETDVGELRGGAPIRLRAWGLMNREITGEIVSIAPTTEERDYGLIVRVITEIPNADGYLRPGMTGHAKIASGHMPVWQAFTRMVVRFFQIELWSWIP